MPRQTRQRGAIRRAFQRAGRPLSPAEVHALARDEASGLGVATVYRSIRRLLDDGWLVSVDLPGSSSRYELAGQSHHHHFRCDRCDRVFDVPCPGGDLREATLPGFVVRAHDVTLLGTCVECAR
jgi:Fur family ferric uptake transcriptional regulator